MDGGQLPLFSLARGVLEHVVKFKIEFVASDGTSLIARRMTSNDFAQSPISRFGGVAIRPAVIQPRKIKPDGRQDLDVFAFAPKVSGDIGSFRWAKSLNLKMPNDRPSPVEEYVE